jgi:hypothetical protein
MIWEMSEKNELTDELAAIRENSFIEFFQMFLMTRENKETLQDVVALIGAAISYLVLRSKNVDVYGGIDLSSEKGWEHIEQTISCMVQGLQGIFKI